MSEMLKGFITYSWTKPNHEQWIHGEIGGNKKSRNNI